MTGWEFDRWEDDGSLIMIRWDRGSDSATRLAELVIKPDGEHYRKKFDKEQYEEAVKYYSK